MADPTPAPKKVCTICGADCSDKPRVKDRRGHYYCKQCHDEALRRKQQQAEHEAKQAMETPPQAPPALSNEPHEPSELEALLSEEASAPAATSSACPGCGQPLQQGAVLCVNCGYNFQSGQQLSAQIEEAPNERKPGGMWPTVIGVIGLIITALGFADLVWSAMTTFSTPMVAPEGVDDESYAAGVRIGSIASLTIFGLLFLWHGIGSVGVLLRRSSGVTALRIWAYVMAIIVCTCGFLILGLMLVSGAFTASEQGGVAALGMGIVIAIVLGLLLFFLAWPVFLIIWFRRETVREDISQW